jgi:hypothetical protein
VAERTGDRSSASWSSCGGWSRGGVPTDEMGRIFPGDRPAAVVENSPGPGKWRCGFTFQSFLLGSRRNSGVARLRRSGGRSFWGRMGWHARLDTIDYTEAPQ